MVCCHGDDLLASGEKEALDFLNKLTVEGYEVKVLSRIGPPEFGAGTHPCGKITWSRDGFAWEADDQYAKLLVS